MNQYSGHVGVVGGGFLGMILALRLREQGARVTLIEAAPDLGGLACPEQIGGYTWDRFYHVILLSDLRTRALLEELGLDQQLRWGETRTGFYTDGSLHSMSNSVEFLRFPPISLLDKFRLGGTIFLASRLRNWRRLEGELATDWLKRWSGGRVLDKIWLPLLKSKLGDNYRIASGAFIWAIIARMYAARRSGLKREMFGYIDGSYQIVIDALRRRLEASGVVTRFGAIAKGIADAGGAATVTLTSSEMLSFDRVVSTLPTGTLAALCPQLNELERARLQDVVYQGIICAAMLTREPLSSFYVTNITDRWVPFTGVIEMTALVDRKHFGGNSLVYLPIYLPQDDPSWKRSDEDIRESCLSAIERMYGHFNRSQVVDFKVSRAKQVLAISTIDYSQRLMPPVRTSLPNVFVLNSAQIANGTLNVNETLGVVDEHLEYLLESMARPAADGTGPVKPSLSSTQAPSTSAVAS